MSRLAFILRLCAALIWGVAALGLGAWLLGRIVSDRWLWSQFLAWMPSVLVLPGVGTGWLVAAGVNTIAHRATSPARPGPGRLALASIGMWLLLAVYVGVFEYRLWPRSAPDPQGPRLRVLHWNCSMTPTSDWADRVGREKPDVFVIVPGAGIDWTLLFNQMGRDASMIFTEGFVIISRVKIVRWMATPLGIEPGEGIDPRREHWVRQYEDPGHALFVELNTAEQLGRSTVLWIVDLPSDPTISRARITEKARQSMLAFTGECRVPAKGPHSIWNAWEAAEYKDVGFPTPDIIVGDWNIPRGSWSLKTLAGDMDNAYDLAGQGYDATWPRRRPIWQLDNAFVSRRLSTLSYRIADFGTGTHRAQILDVGPLTAPNP